MTKFCNSSHSFWLGGLDWPVPKAAAGPDLAHYREVLTPLSLGNADNTIISIISNQRNNIPKRFILCWFQFTILQDESFIQLTCINAAPSSASCLKKSTVISLSGGLDSP